jgi:MFS family permease
VSLPHPARPALVTPVFVLVTVATFAYFIGIGATLPTLPVYVDGPLGGGPLGVGVGVGSYSVTALFLRPFAGRVGDRHGRRILIVAGACLVAASIAGYLAASSIAILVAMRLVTGVGEAMFFTGAASMVNDLAPEERRGEAVSYFSLALYGGLAIGPLFGEGLLHEFDFDAVWWTAAAFACLAGILALRVPDTRPTDAETRPRGRLVHPAALVPGLVLMTSVWGFSAFSSFVPLYARDVGMSGSRFVFLVYSVVILSIRALGATIPDRLGALRTVRVALVVSMTGLLVMAAWATPAGLFLAAGILAVGQALAFPALMTLAVRAAPASERGSVVGTFTAFFDLAYGVGAAALGGIAEVVGFRGTFAAAAAAAVAGIALITRQRQQVAEARAAPGRVRRSRS